MLGRLVSRSRAPAIIKSCSICSAQTSRKENFGNNFQESGERVIRPALSLGGMREPFQREIIQPPRTKAPADSGAGRTSQGSQRQCLGIHADPRDRRNSRPRIP